MVFYFLFSLFLSPPGVNGVITFSYEDIFYVFSNPPRPGGYRIMFFFFFFFFFFLHPGWVFAPSTSVLDGPG